MDPGSSAPAVARSIGLVLGLGLSVAAVTPSLLPRPPVFQGFLAGVGFTLGHGLGVLLVGLVLRAAAARRTLMTSTVSTTALRPPVMDSKLTSFTHSLFER